MSSLERMPIEPSRGRPRGFTEHAALDAAMQVFWNKGYRATSIDDLVERTGASRASLYKMFGEKRDVFIKCLDLYALRFETNAAQALALDTGMVATAGAMLIASAERLLQPDAPNGCLRCESTGTLMGLDAAIDEALRRTNDRYYAVMRSIVERGIERGEAMPDRKEALATFLVGAVGGLVSLAHMNTKREFLLGFIETVLETLGRG